MLKEPIKTDVAPVDLEEDVEKAVTGAIEASVPPELQGQASTVVNALLLETQRRPLTALIAAAAVGYVVAVILKN